MEIQQKIQAEIFEVAIYTIPTWKKTVKLKTQTEFTLNGNIKTNKRTKRKLCNANKCTCCFIIIMIAIYVVLLRDIMGMIVSFLDAAVS